MVAGDSAKRLLPYEVFQSSSRSVYQPQRSVIFWKGGRRLPLQHAEPLSRLHIASFFTHCVKFLFFLLLFTFWRLSLCAGCGKVFRNGEVIHHRQPPPLPSPPQTHRHTPPTFHTVPMTSPPRLCPTSSSSTETKTWMEPHSEQISADLGAQAGDKPTSHQEAGPTVVLKKAQYCKY